jgi:hypothetical protein
LPAGYTEGTDAYTALAKLVTSTPLDQLPTEQELRALSAWPEEKEAELKRVAEALNNDPKTLMRLRNEAKQALETIKDEVTKVIEYLADPAIAQIRTQQQDADTKARAAETAARDLFSGEPIPDVGSEVWRQMLLYARQFAASAFADKEPPQLASGGICVLCQQDLNADAARRLAAFDSFIAGRSAEDSASPARFSRSVQEPD